MIAAHTNLSSMLIPQRGWASVGRECEWRMCTCAKATAHSSSCSAKRGAERLRWMFFRMILNGRSSVEKKEASKRAPRRPKRAPKRRPRRPRRPKSVPRRPQEVPKKGNTNRKSEPFTPRGSQEAPRGPSRGSLEATRGFQAASQEGPKRQKT